MKRFWFTSALFLFFLPVSVFAGRTLLVADETSPFVQNGRADNDDLSRMEDEAMLRRFVNAGYLVSVPSSTSHYYIHNIPATYRYTRPWTKQFLQRLSSQFHAKFNHRLRVTSLVRTEGRQIRLARQNPNAAEAVGDTRSSHLTGATIDISKRFMTTAERRWMRDVLYSLRNQGYLYAIEEFGQPTFHIMVYRSYPQYVAILTGKKVRKRSKPEFKTATLEMKQSDEPGKKSLSE